MLKKKKIPLDFFKKISLGYSFTGGKIFQGNTTHTCFYWLKLFRNIIKHES